MRDELISFQQIAVSRLLAEIASAKAYHKADGRPQVIAFRAPTGSGKTIVMTTVIEDILNGTETTVEIHTDEKIVGTALLNLGLIEGEEGPYGMYTKKVNGISADYDKDGVYWAFYEGGEYAMKGVDQTEIVPGATYAFKVEK